MPSVPPPLPPRPRRGPASLGGAFGLALLAALGAPLRAEELSLPRQARPGAPLPGIGSPDRRVPVDAAEAPWRALGRVQLEVGGRCTGTLVGPRSVLTAAHCLVARRTRALVRPGTVHFLLGYGMGGYAAHARVASYVVGPGYDNAGNPSPGADWALLTLERPLEVGADRILPLRRDLPPPRTPLMLGGYQQDRPEVLLADTGCSAIGIGRDGAGQAMLLHDCAGTRGVSGAPLLARGADGRWEVVGIASTVAARAALGMAVAASAVGPVP